MSRLMRLILGVFFFIFASSAFADSEIVPLSEARDRLHLPSYTSFQRQTLASQASFMIKELYVHRDQKVIDFGAQIDPVPRLEDLTREASTLSNEQLHEKLSSIFLDLHDLHTNYMAPRPLACAISFVPLRFESVLSDGKEQIVVSQKLKIKSELTNHIPLGSHLLEIDDQNVEDVISQLSRSSGGANADAMRMRAIQMLGFRSLISQAVPTKDVIRLKFEGQSKPVEMPWFAFIDKSCEESAKQKEMSFPQLLRTGEDHFQKQFNKVFGVPSLKTALDTVVKSPLSEVFDAGLLTTPAGKMAYLRLKQFIWSNPALDVETLVEATRRVLEGELAKGMGLVIDVRGNPGGNIVFAEKLIQLFSSREVQPSTVRMLANSLNERIFLKANGGRDNRWSFAIRDATKQQSRYTDPLALTPASEANKVGQVWFKPVILLTDAACFSACDMFVAGMQDSGAGVVIGLQHNTGGGGANVMEYNTFARIFATDTNNPFKTLPFGQNMRVAWRQAIRSGKNAGTLIEDKGVISDKIVRLTPDDIGGEPKELMRQVHDYLNQLLPNYRSSLGGKRGGLVLLNNGESARWSEKVVGVDSIDLMVNGARAATTAVSAETKPAEVTLQIDSLSGKWKNQPVVLVGKRNGEPVFRAVRNLMWRGEYAAIPEAGRDVDLSGSSLEPLHTVLLKGAEGSGWQVVNGKLRIGPGPKYDNNVLAQAFLPLNLKQEGASVTLDISLEAEDLNDSLRIYALNPETGERLNYFAGSHLAFRQGVRIPLPTEWDHADLVFEFESDENWNMAGPSISNVHVERLN